MSSMTRANAMNESNVAAFQRVAPRAFRLLAGTAYRCSEADNGARMPDASDAYAIALRIRANTQRTCVDEPKRRGYSRDETNDIAADLVNGATRVVMGLQAGAQAKDIAYQDLLALETVLTTRGRPALAVLAGQIERLHADKHSACEMWRAPLELHESNLVAAANATGAVMVTRKGRREPSVQGSAWLIQPDLAISNRHVLFPDLGTQLALRRRDDPTAASLPEGLDVWIDFAFDDGPRREQRYNIIDVPYVSREHDPVDVAILRIQPAAANSRPALQPLHLARSTAVPEELYVVGHPCRIDGRIPENVRAVFGIPDERKRVSLGKSLDHDALDVFHDASTIDGYSGGCLLGFMSKEVIGLHYYGDPITGNRAVRVQALRRHMVAKFLPN
jgi:hypothetical protein